MNLQTEIKFNTCKVELKMAHGTGNNELYLKGRSLRVQTFLKIATLGVP